MSTVIHFASKEQVDVLRQLFTAPKRVVFEWPLAGGEKQEETMEWITPKWVEVMDETVRTDGASKLSGAQRHVNKIRLAMKNAKSKSEMKRLTSFLLDANKSKTDWM